MKEKKKQSKLQASKKYSIVIISAILLLVAIFSLGLSAKRFAAAQAFFQARKYAFDINLQPQVEKWVEFAIRWDKNNDNYHRQLANFYIINVNDLRSFSPKEGFEDEYNTTLQGFVEKANKYAVQAVETNPSNYLNHITLADFYASTHGLAPDALAWAESSLNNALAVFPNNVDILNRIATVQLDQIRALLLVRANLAQEEQDTTQVDAALGTLFESASQNIQKAIELKNDFLLGYYTLALIQWEAGNLDQAIEVMNGLQAAVPNDIGVKFYLALMYDQKEDTEKAIEILNQALSLAPNFSDGYWTLARIYAQQGQISLAEENLKKILEYDPQNQIVQQALDGLSQSTEFEPEIISPSIPGPEEIDEIDINEPESIIDTTIETTADELIDVSN